MFEKVEDYPVDPIMTGADYFAADPRADKLNLTVGIYQDEHGNPCLITRQVLKCYWLKPAFSGDAALGAVTFAVVAKPHALVRSEIGAFFQCTEFAQWRFR